MTAPERMNTCWRCHGHKVEGLLSSTDAKGVRHTVPCLICKGTGVSKSLPPQPPRVPSDRTINMARARERPPEPHEMTDGHLARAIAYTRRRLAALEAEQGERTKQKALERKGPHGSG